MSPQDLLTFIHFNHFTAEWRRLGLTDDDLRWLEMLIMELPVRAPVMQGTGGLRKLRFAPPRWRTGKSGALRIGYVYLEQYSVVGLVVVFAKNNKANLTMKEPTSQGAHRRVQAVSGTRAECERTWQMKKRREAKSAFGQAVIKSFEEFLEAAERGEPITARRVKLDLEPRPFSANDIKRLRRRLGVSQTVFSQLIAVSVKTIQAWESGTSDAPPMACRLLDEIAASPEEWLRRQWARSARRRPVTIRA